MSIWVKVEVKKPVSLPAVGWLSELQYLLLGSRRIDIYFLREAEN